MCRPLSISPPAASPQVRPLYVILANVAPELKECLEMARTTMRRPQRPTIPSSPLTPRCGARGIALPLQKDWLGSYRVVHFCDCLSPALPLL